ncbi:MAG: hypothetical protein JOZ69_15290, partial [Myxococcales bacterium]|nr:hypothetical protein [Myxococcales bacterium]
MGTNTTRPPAWIETGPSADRRRRRPLRGLSSRGRRRVALPAALALLFAAPARASEPKEKDQCILAADQGQQLRDATKYLEARESFARCARESCPAIVKQDCTQWLQDLDERTPTVVFAAQDDRGADLVDVRVSIDGAQVATSLEGKPVPIDPGEHALHYESGGYLPVDGRAVIRAGEKNRVLDVQFRDRVVAQVPPPAVRSPPTRAAEAAWRPPLAAWVFGGVALAAFATEAYFGV